MLNKSRFNIIFFLLTLSFIILIYRDSIAQTDLGTSFVTGKPGATTMLRDYEAIGVNPANLGFDDNNRFSLGLAGINFNLQSKGINFNNLYSLVDSLFAKKSNSNNNSNNSNSNSNSNNNSNNNNISLNQIDQIIKLINNDGMNLNTSVTLAGMSLHLGRFGGIGFSLRDRILTHVSNNNFTPTTLDTLINGKKTPPISSELNGTNLSTQYLRELNVAYGRKLPQLLPNLDIYAGIGYRYIWGLEYANLTSDNNFTIIQSTINGSNYTENFANLLHVPLKSSDMFSGDGHGSAIDIGANAVWLKKIKLGISFNNIGSVKWNSMQEAKVNDDTLKNHLNTFGDLFNHTGFKPVPGFITYLPAECRIGAGIKLGRLLEVGGDIAMPLNKPTAYNTQVIKSLGVQLNLSEGLRFNTGISGNSSIGWNVPLGITLSVYGFYDIYIATNDILTYVNNKTRNPMVSFAVCGIRFNLPARKIKNIPKLSDDENDENDEDAEDDE